MSHLFYTVVKVVFYWRNCRFNRPMRGQRNRVVVNHGERLFSSFPITGFEVQQPPTTALMSLLVAPLWTTSEQPASGSSYGKEDRCPLNVTRSDQIMPRCLAFFFYFWNSKRPEDFDACSSRIKIKSRFCGFSSPNCPLRPLSPDLKGEKGPGCLKE